MNFLSNSRLIASYLSSDPLVISSGVSYQNMVLTLVDYGKLL